LLIPIVGQPAIVVTHKPYYDQTKTLEDVLGTFSTINQLGGQPGQRLRDRVPRHPGPGTRRAGDPGRPVVCRCARRAAIGVGFLVWGLVAGLGGPSGPVLNPARDLGPRIVHALSSKYKGSSQWRCSWVPVAARVFGALVGVGIFTWLLG
jgi:glycerol uptake facilitator protein